MSCLIGTHARMQTHLAYTSMPTLGHELLTNLEAKADETHGDFPAKNYEAVVILHEFLEHLR